MAHFRECKPAFFFDPHHFTKYPVGVKMIRFILVRAYNIQGARLFAGVMENLLTQYDRDSSVYTVDHPFVCDFSIHKNHYPWMFPGIDEVPDAFSSGRKKVFQAQEKNKFA